LTSGVIAEPLAPESPKIEESTPVPPQPPNQVTASDVPQPKTLAEIIIERLDALDKKYETLGNAVVRIAERLDSPTAIVPAAQSTAMAGPMGQYQGIIDLARTFLSSGGESDSLNEIYLSVGKQIVDKNLQGVISRVVRTTASETASHVTGHIG